MAGVYNERGAEMKTIKEIEIKANEIFPKNDFDSIFYREIFIRGAKFAIEKENNENKRTTKKN